MSDRKKAFWFIALLSVLVVVPFLGETIFYSKGEPREAIVALSMLESGNWILPVNYGTDIAYKPPFFYWSIVRRLFPFGEVTEFSARFPSALAFLAMQLMFFAFVAKRKKRSNGAREALKTAYAYAPGTPHRQTLRYAKHIQRPAELVFKPAQQRQRQREHIPLCPG